MDTKVKKAYEVLEAFKSTFEVSNEQIYILREAILHLERQVEQLQAEGNKYNGHF